jgi:hypothetical protein
MKGFGPIQHDNVAGRPSEGDTKALAILFPDYAVSSADFGW